ncbi:MAG: membrane dipeptidase [Johnsonella sp.]|nr:membrane dipeptidase [Johnsonella sp.]
MIFDGHTDVLTDVVRRREKGEEDVFCTHHLPKWKKSGIRGGIFVIWIDYPHYHRPKERLQEILRAAEAELAQTKEVLQLVTKKKDFLKEEKKITMILGMEGLSHVDEERGTEVLDDYYRLGLRHASLTWNEENALATGVRGDEERGLTGLGREAVRKLNTLGVILDVSHLNERSFWDLADASDRPFIASHSNCAALCPHKRNLKDEQIREIGKRGGLVGLNSYCSFIHSEKEKQNPEGLARHAARIADLIGPEHLVFGFDFCDFLDHEEGTKGLEDAGEAYHMLSSLENLGFSKKELEMISHLNYRNYIEKIWKE